MMKKYKHTQIGYLILISLGVALLFITTFSLKTGFNPTTLAVLIIILICLGLFATLTVEVDDKMIKIRFGPGVINKAFPLKELEASRVVKNPWYYGWGIRLIPGGWLFNVSGLWAVELQMKNGKKYRIGTDDPTGLVKAVEEVINYLPGR